MESGSVGWNPGTAGPGIIIVGMLPLPRGRQASPSDGPGLSGGNKLNGSWEGPVVTESDMLPLPWGRQARPGASPLPLP